MLEATTAEHNCGDGLDSKAAHTTIRCCVVANNLLPNSPAINAGTSVGAPLDDFYGRRRDTRPDIGAYEWWEATSALYLPMIVH